MNVETKKSDPTSMILTWARSWLEELKEIFESYYNDSIVEEEPGIKKEYSDIIEKKVLEINLPYSSEEVDKIKIEFIPEGNIYSGILGRGKYVYIEVPSRLLIENENYEGTEYIFTYDWYKKIIVRKKKVYDRIILNTRKIKIRFKDGITKEINFPRISFFIGNIKKNNVATKLGILSIYLTIWKKNVTIPENILIGQINVYVDGHALFKRRDRPVVRKKFINIKGVQYQPPRYIKIGDRLIRDFEIDYQNLPEGLFVVLNGYFTDLKDKYYFKLANSKKKVGGKLTRVLKLKFVENNVYGTIKFGNQRFTVKEKTNLEKYLLRRGERITNKEYVLKWINGHELKHALKSNKPFDVYIRDGTEEILGEKVQYREWLIGSTENSLEIIIFNKHHQDAFPVLRIKLNSNDVLVIRHYDPHHKIEDIIKKKKKVLASTP